jgi:hypothetical protein
MLETFTTTEEGPKMLNPVVIPLPVALAFIVAFAAALYAANRFLRTDVWNPWDGQAWSSPAPTGGRHRPESIPEADRRDWAYIVAMRMSESAQRQHRENQPRIATSAPLEIEASPVRYELVVQHGWPLQIAGLPDREPVEPGPLHVAGDVEWDTRELAAIR